MRIAIRFEYDWLPEDLPDFARWAEKVGYDELWFSEDFPWHGCMVMAATALASTTRLRVGVGLMPAITRNVATLAMELGALARLAPGRLTIGIGHGVPVWMEQIGAVSPVRFAVLEETISCLRRLLKGETVTFDGKHVHLKDVKLGYPPEQPPLILTGTTGPQGIRLAGRCSDGLLLPEMATPDAVRWGRAQMAEAGRAGTSIVFALVSVDENRGRALAEVREKLQRIVDFQVYPQLQELAGLGADGSGEMTDAIVHALAAAGTPEDCARSVEAWRDAGAECLILVGGADDKRASYERFAAEVLPLLGKTPA